MDPEDLANLIFYPENRIQGGHGLLKDHGNIISPDLAHLGFGQRQKINTIEKDTSADNFSRGGRDKSQDGKGHDRLAATGFTHETKCVPLFQMEIHTVHSSGYAISRPEYGPQVPYL